MADREGLVSGLPEADYHGGPELSSTGAKQILKCPAQFHWNRTHYAPRKTAFDKGTLVHRLILGTGPRIQVVDAYDWRTKAAQTARKEAAARGRTVVHRGDLRDASRVAARARATPDVADVFNREGAAEVSLFADDPDTGIRLRGRIDWLTEAGGRPCIFDVKTTSKDTHDRELARSFADLGYHQQAAWYVDLLDLCGQPDAAFYFVVVPLDVDGPHGPRIVELAPSAIERGRELNRRAITLFRWCLTTDEWPCHDGTFTTLDLPGWAYIDKETDHGLTD